MIQRSRGTFSSADDAVRLVCAYSRTYGAAPQGGFWFAFHPYQKDYLEESERGYIAFACGDAATVLLIPVSDFARWLPGMHETVSPDRRYCTSGSSAPAGDSRCIAAKDRNASI